MKIGYPPEFVRDTKEAYPYFSVLHDTLEDGDPNVLEFLNWPEHLFTAEEIIDAREQNKFDRLYEKALCIVRRKKLLARCREIISKQNAKTV